MDNGTHYDKTEAMMDIEERLNRLEMNMDCIVSFIYRMQQTTMGFSIQQPPPRLPFEREEQPALLTAPAHLHFGLDPQLRAHWADVYGRLLAARKLRADEVSSMNFTYLMCGAGTAPLGPVRWYGTTRELAYMVRTQLNSKWEVAFTAFNDKNNNPLPKTLKNTKAPSAENMKKIDLIFRKKD